MSERENIAALDIYSFGWSRGDSAIICRVVDTSFTFSGLPNMDKVDKNNFGNFWEKFGSSIENCGGHKSASSAFRKVSNIIRRKVNFLRIFFILIFNTQEKDGIEESGHWSVAGYGEGYYKIFAFGGNIMWEEVAIIESEEIDETHKSERKVIWEDEVLEKLEVVEEHSDNVELERYKEMIGI